MYTVTPPRSVSDAARALVVGTDHSPALVVDALRTLIVLRDERNQADRQIRQRSFEWNATRIPKVDRNRLVPGIVQDLTYLKARRVLSDVFPGMDSETPVHIAGHFTQRDDPLEPILRALTDPFVYGCALLLKAGATQDYLWLWWTHGDVNLPLIANWTARWDLLSFNACLKAGYSTAELSRVLDNGTLPDPDTIAVLAALRGPVSSPF